MESFRRYSFRINQIPVFVGIYSLADSEECQESKIRFRRGFSLVELLVVIAVIAIIAAIAIPNIANISQTADAAKVRRNAQTVAATYNAAVAAGMHTNVASTLEDAVLIIREGTNIVIGNTSQYYSVDGLSPEESARAQEHLSFSNGLIVISAQ